MDGGANESSPSSPPEAGSILEAGSANITGTFGGTTLNVQSAFAGTGFGPGADAGSVLYASVIGIGSVANACELIAMHPDQPGAFHDSQGMNLVLLTDSPLAPGTIPIMQIDPNVANITTVGALATYEADNATCVLTSAEEALSGSVTIATVTASEITGSFDVMLGEVFVTGTIDTSNLDHVTGSFSAPICPAYNTDVMAAAESDGSAPAADAGVCL
jgi:hypothetical protein